MTGTNHALTGALIAAAIPSPFLALPLAFASHFVLDSLPHYGEPAGQRKKLFKAMVAIDGLALAIGLVMAVITENYWPALAAFVAISPDFFWIARFIFKEDWGRKKPGPKNWFNQWHSDIQKYERRWGVWVELVYFVVFAFLAFRFVL